MKNCKWLPALYPDPDWNNYMYYEETLYEWFWKTYLDPQYPLVFNQKIVRYRHHPKTNDKEEVFYHLTCKKYRGDNERKPDANRIVRIKWPKAFIENYDCSNSCCVEKPLYWKDLKNKSILHKIFHLNYLVVIEERERYCLLVTGFYVEETYYRRGLLKEYEKSKKAKGATF